jgi:hypothetical protein
MPVDRVIDMQMSRRWRKLGDDPREPMIRTVRGDGYLSHPPLFDAEMAASSVEGADRPHRPAPRLMMIS